LRCRFGSQAATETDHLPADDAADTKRRPAGGDEPLATRCLVSLTATAAV
jgi:hypothetical protein